MRFKNYFLLTLLCFLLLTFLNAAIQPLTQQNVDALKHFFVTIDNIGSIPDAMFGGMRSGGMPEGFSGIIPNGPYAGDWFSDSALSGSPYARQILMRDGGSTGPTVMTVNYTLSPAKGQIMIQPYYFNSSEAALQSSTRMKLTYDYSNSNAQVYTVLMRNMKAQPVTSTGNPIHQYIAITKNASTNEYFISSTMIFVENDFAAGLQSVPSYNVGTVFFNAFVKGADGRAVIYTDRAAAAGHNGINQGTADDGPWPVPFYFDANTLYATPNGVTVVEPVPSWFTPTEKANAFALPLKSHDDVKTNMPINE